MNFFTNHDYTYNNINLVFINPLLFAAIPLGLFAAFSQNQKKRHNSTLLLKVLWSYVFLGGMLTIVLRFFPGFYQQNQPTQALILPLAFVLSIIPNVLYYYYYLMVLPKMKLPAVSRRVVNQTFESIKKSEK